jgi:hypothetical protein
MAARCGGTFAAQTHALPLTNQGWGCTRGKRRRAGGAAQQSAHVHAYVCFVSVCVCVFVGAYVRMHASIHTHVHESACVLAWLM